MAIHNAEEYTHQNNQNGTHYQKGNTEEEDERRSKKRDWPDELFLENTRRIFVSQQQGYRNRGWDRKKNEGGITGNREKIVEKQNGGRTAHLCPSVLVALCSLAELQWPRAILEQIRLPLCVHYFLLTFAKRYSSWPWEIDEGPKMSLYLPGPFMLPWEQ